MANQSRRVESPLFKSFDGPRPVRNDWLIYMIDIASNKTIPIDKKKSKKN